MNEKVESIKSKGTELFQEVSQKVQKIEVKELLSKNEDGALNITSKINEFFDGLNVKLMGTYEEIEAYEKAKEGKKSA